MSASRWQWWRRDSEGVGLLEVGGFVSLRDDKRPTCSTSRGKACHCEGYLGRWRLWRSQGWRELKGLWGLDGNITNGLYFMFMTYLGNEMRVCDRYVNAAAMAGLLFFFFLPGKHAVQKTFRFDSFGKTIFHASWRLLPLWCKGTWKCANCREVSNTSIHTTIFALVQLAIQWEKNYVLGFETS